MEEQNNQNIEVKSDDSKSTMMILGGLVLMAVLVGGYLLMKANTGKEVVTTTNKTVASPTTMVEGSETTEEVTTATVGDEAVVQDGVVLNVEGGSFYFKPNVIRAKVDQEINIKFTSVGGMPHDFVIDEFKVNTKEITEDSLDVAFTPDKVGTFEFYCSVGSHRKMGMKGTLIIE